MFNGKKLFEYITSFSKIITIVWIAIWVETILFTQAATVFQLGDVTALQYINDNVIQIGVIVCGFYFCTKTIENVAQGIECFFTEENAKKRLFNINGVVDVTPVEENEECITDEDVIEPTPVSNLPFQEDSVVEPEPVQNVCEEELV